MRAIAFCLLLLACAWSFASAAYAEDESARAYEAWNAGRLAEALTFSERAVESRPQSAYAWTLRAFLLSRAGRKSEALDAYERASTLTPDDAIVQNNLGVLLLEHGRISEAEGRFRRALALKPGYADAWNNLGAAQERAGRRGQAAGSYEAAVEADPAHARAHSNLGTIALLQGRRDEARRRFEQASDLEPGLGAPVLNLLLLGPDAELAGTTRERLLRAARDPRAPQAVRVRSLAALAGRAATARRFEEARALYLEALGIVGEDAMLLNNLAVAEDQLGMDREAMLHLEAALRLRPGLPVAYNNMGIVHVHRGSFEQAEQIFRDILQRDPAFHRAHYNLGVVLSALGRLNEALGSFEWAATLAPRDASVRYNLGVLRRRLGGDEATERRSYEDAIRLDPDLGEAHLALGCFLADPQTRGDLRDEATARFHLERFLALALESDDEGRQRANAWLRWLDSRR